MSSIHFRNLSFTYPGSAPILDAASCSLGDGWTGVVGVNGAGKTTILRLIDGSLSPGGGVMELAPADAVVVHCPQTADTIDENIESFAAAWDGSAQALFGRLDLIREDLERWPTLSPGERKRWQIGAALHQQPDVLLLDEPTNHLDGAARTLLLDALARFPRVGVVVSHDRVVLNELCRRVLRVEVGQISLWQGGYETARAAWEHEEQAMIDSYQKVKAEKKSVERRLADKRRVAAAKLASRRKELRNAAPRDKDVRSMAAKGRFEGGQAQASHDMRVLREEAGRLDQAARSFDLRRRLGGELFFDYEPAKRRHLMSYRGPLEVAGPTLVEAVDVTLSRDDRVRLAGPNGVGKSTLLGELLDATTVDDDRILYLPQELTEDQTRELLTEVRSLDATAKGRVLGIVGVLGSDPKRILATELPSPGETRKLLIASGLGRGVWVMVLDEPTNHLDLPSIERLEAALGAYPGALVLVSHDEEFATELTSTTWTLSPEGLVITHQSVH